MKKYRIIRRHTDAPPEVVAIRAAKRPALAEAAELRAKDRRHHYAVQETRRRGDCLEVKTVWSSALAELAEVSPLRGNLRDDG